MIMFAFLLLFSSLIWRDISSPDIILDLLSNSKLLNKTTNKKPQNNSAKHWEFKGGTWKSNAAELV